MSLQGFLEKIKRKTSPHSQMLSWWEFEIKDKDGKIIQRVRQPAQSLVINGLDFLRLQWYHESAYTMRTTLGSTYPERMNYAAMISGSTGLSGIIVGTGGSVPVTITDYKLNIRIDHGTSSGQLVYTANVFVPTAIDGTTSYFTIAQPLTNSSGGSIIVSEAGIYVYGGYGYLYCIERTVVSPGITIPIGGTATVNYHLGVQLV